MISPSYYSEMAEILEALDPDRWQALCLRLGLGEQDNVFQQLEKKYGQRHRKYHNASHVNACLAHLDTATHEEASNAYIEYALWFHDAIYDTHSSKNEARSAQWAVEVLQSAAADSEALQLVDALIMATCHGEVPTIPSHQLLVDIDLAILGSSTERFALFEKQVRQEYWWVPGATFRKKRIEVLQSLVERPTIYTTTDFQQQFEEQARSNIASAIAALKS